MILESKLYKWSLCSPKVNSKGIVVVGQSESCMVCLSLGLSLMSTESLIEVLMSTMSLTVVFDCGLVPGLGPLWSPS